MRKKRAKILFFMIVELTLIVVQFFRIQSMIMDIAYSSVNSQVSNCSYGAIELSLCEDNAYNRIINIEKNNDGDIILITTNTPNINRLCTDLSLNTYNLLYEVAESGVDVPFGVFSGIKLLSGFGKKSKVKVIGISSVSAKIKNRFVSKGINQTLHTVYAEITTTIDLVTITETRVTEQSIEVMLYENLIVGKIPDTYFSF